MNVRWFKIKSWHIWGGTVSRANFPRAVCGRWAMSPDTVDDRPGNEKSCESCLRIAGPK